MEIVKKIMGVQMSILECKTGASDLRILDMVILELKSQQAEIDQLKADLLEMAEAYCYGSTDVSFRLKAVQIIKGIK